MRPAQPMIRRRWKIAAAVVACLLLAAGGARVFWPQLLMRRVERTFSFQLTADAPRATLYFPSYSAPRLLDYTLRNAGVSAIHTPRLLNNDRPRLWTLDEIIDTVGGRAQDPDVFVLALYDFFRANLAHARDEDFQIGVPADDLLQALNFVGLTQCGEISAFICQLAERVGLPAHRVFIDRDHPWGHIVAEIFWDHAWRMIDADRDFIFPAADYRRLLSLAELRGDPSPLHRAPFDTLNRYYFKERVLLTGQASAMPTPAVTPELYTRERDLAPDAELRFDTRFNPRTKGCAVTLRAVEHPAGGEWAVNLPYPVLSLALRTDQPLVLEEPQRRTEYRWRSRHPLVIGYVPDARPWLLPLAEGVNRLAVDSLSPQWKVAVTVRVSLIESR